MVSFLPGSKSRVNGLTAPRRCSTVSATRWPLLIVWVARVIWVAREVYVARRAGGWQCPLHGQAPLLGSGLALGDAVGQAGGVFRPYQPLGEEPLHDEAGQPVRWRAHSSSVADAR